MIELTRENRAAFSRKTFISMAFRRLPQGLYRALPYSLPMLAVAKLRNGGVRNIADVTYLLGVADGDELTVVRRLAAGEDSEFADDIENLIAIGQLEAEMRRRR